MLSVESALQTISNNVRPVDPQLVALPDALGTHIAVEVVSPDDSPPFDKSMMDGYAVKTSDLTPGHVTLSVIDEVTAGNVSVRKVERGHAVRIMTGAPIPTGADAVIPVEQSEQIDDQKVQLTIDVVPQIGLNITSRGSNMRSGEVILPAARRIRPQEVALLAEIGAYEVSVRRAPRVAILATGDELVDINQTPGHGQIRNSNATMLAAQVAACGADPIILGIARDQRSDLQQKIQEGLKADILCLSGGVSAGKLDLVPSELAAAGVEEIFHKVAMKPGKPIWFGRRLSADTSVCYVFGLPGNPVSSMVCFELFVRSAIVRFCGLEPKHTKLLHALLDVDYRHDDERHLWLPSFAFMKNGELRVRPVGWKGSSDLRSTVEANCSVSFPGGEKEYRINESVEILIWSGSQFPEMW